MAIARSTTCRFCGLVYDEMRTGLTYQCIYSMLWSSSDDPRDWRYKRRHTILGMWHSIKRDQWFEHVDQCEDIETKVRGHRLAQEEARAEREAIIAAETMPDIASSPFDDVPF